jgi:hypothetical protein
MREFLPAWGRTAALRRPCNSLSPGQYGARPIRPAPRPVPFRYAISNAPQLAEVNPANVQSFALVRFAPSDTSPVM